MLVNYLVDESLIFHFVISSPISPSPALNLNKLKESNYITFQFLMGTSTCTTKQNYIIIMLQENKISKHNLMKIDMNNFLFFLIKLFDYETKKDSYPINDALTVQKRQTKWTGNVINN